MGRKPKWLRTGMTVVAIVLAIMIARAVGRYQAKSDLAQHDRKSIREFQEKAERTLDAIAEEIHKEPVPPKEFHSFSSYTYQSDGFQISFPSAPHLRPFGIAKEYSCPLDDGVLLSVIVNDLRDLRIEGSKAAGIFLKAELKSKMDVLSKVGAKLISSRFAPHKGLPAISYEYTVGMEGTTVYRIGTNIMAGRRCYGVSTLFQKDNSILARERHRTLVSSFKYIGSEN